MIAGGGTPQKLKPNSEIRSDAARRRSAGRAARTARILRRNCAFASATELPFLASVNWLRFGEYNDLAGGH